MLVLLSQTASFPLSASLCSTLCFPPLVFPFRFILSCVFTFHFLLLIPFIPSHSSPSVQHDSLGFWSDHGRWCQQASLWFYTICARASWYRAPCKYILAAGEAEEFACVICDVVSDGNKKKNQPKIRAKELIICWLHYTKARSVWLRHTHMHTLQQW